MSNLDWGNLGFAYRETKERYVSNYKNGAWDDGVMTTEDTVTISECAGVLQYCQACFEGLKAYRTEDGRIVTFRPDLNAQRMADSAKRLEMPVFPEDRFIEAVEKVVAANKDMVPPYGSGATLYLRPYMFGSSPVIGVKPAEEYQFRVFCTPVGPYFKGGAKPITIRVCCLEDPLLIMETRVLNAMDNAWALDGAAKQVPTRTAREYLRTFAEIVEIPAFAELPTNASYTNKRLGAVLIDRDSLSEQIAWDNVESLRCAEQRMTGYNLGGASALGVYRGNPACGVLFNTQ